MIGRAASTGVPTAVALLAILTPALAQPPDRPGDTVLAAQRLRRPVAEARLLLMPPSVKLYEVSATGAQARADWTATATGHIDEALASQLGPRTAGVVRYQAPAEAERQREQTQVLKLHALVMRAILTHGLNPRFQLPNKGGRFDWTLGEHARGLGGETAADYALFTEFVDGYSSAGRVALNVTAAILGGVIQHGRQAILASLVDLATGEVVWVNVHTDASGDLRTADSAAKAVRKLLRDLPR